MGRPWTFAVPVALSLVPVVASARDPGSVAAREQERREQVAAPVLTEDDARRGGALPGWVRE